MSNRNRDINTPQCEYTRNRIEELRTIKGVARHTMSADIDRSRNYIHNIVSGKALPSMTEFFLICDYFKISARDFFESEEKNPAIINEIISELNNADDETKNAVLTYLKVSKVIGNKKS